MAQEQLSSVASELAIAYAVYSALYQGDDVVSEKQFVENYKSHELTFRALLGLDQNI